MCGRFYPNSVAVARVF
ncbi:hypothetical protein [Blautia faecis]